MGNLHLMGQAIGKLANAHVYDQPDGWVAGHFWLLGEVYDGVARVESEIKVVFPSYFTKQVERLDGKRVIVSWKKLGIENLSLPETSPHFVVTVDCIALDYA